MMQCCAPAELCLTMFAPDSGCEPSDRQSNVPHLASRGVDGCSHLCLIFSLNLSQHRLSYGLDFVTLATN